MPFVGRQRQVAALHSALEAAESGEFALALVAGEPGVGKTRLIDEVTQQVGMDVVAVRCWSGPGTPAYWLWVQVLRQLTPSNVASPPVTALLAQTLSADAGPDARFRLFDAVVEAVATACRTKPRVLVVDDLHRADEGSLRLLQFLARDPRTAALAIVGAYSEGDVDDSSGLADCLGEIARDGLHVALSGLGDDDVAQLAASMLPDADVTPRMASLLHRLSGGNPLFLNELVSLLESDGSLRHVGHASRRALPAGVRAVVSRRLDSLSPATRGVLQAAAVVGTDFELSVVGAATGLSAEGLLAAVDDVTRDGLLVPGPGNHGTLSFAHGIVREVLYGELSWAARTALHDRLAAVLEERYGDARPREWAHHLLLGRGLQDSRVVDAAVRAAEQSMGLLAYEEAADWYLRATDAVRIQDPHGSKEGELLLSCGQARLAAGDLRAARRAFTEVAVVARRLKDPELLARAALGLGSGPSGFEVPLLDAVQIELLEQALDALDAAPSALRARVLARLSVASSFMDDEGRRAALSDAAVAMARAVGDPSTLGYALAVHCDLVAGPAHCDTRLTESREIVALGHRTGDRQLELLGRRLRLVALLESGDVSEADREIDRFDRVAQLLRQPLYRWYVPLWRGARALMRGDVNESARQCAAAQEQGALAQSQNATVLVFTQWWVRQRYEGRIAEAGVAMAEALSHVPEDQRPAPGPPVTAGPRAVAAAQTGDDDTARVLLTQWIAARMHERSPDSEWLPETAQIAQLAVHLGARDVAAVLFEQLKPFVHRFCVEGIGAAFTGSVAWYLASLARFLDHAEEAHAYDARAKAAHDRVGLVGDPPPLVSPRPPQARPVAATAAGTALLAREGPTWAVAFAGRTARLKDSKGLAGLAVLLSQPEKDVHCLELMGAQDVGADTGPVIDQQARRAYERRIRDLQEDIDEARDLGDSYRAERAERELDALVQHLSEAFGLSGRSRSKGSASERARSAVGWRIRAALRQTAQEHPELGRHLRNSVRMGTWCSYRPESPVRWTIDIREGVEPTA